MPREPRVLGDDIHYHLVLRCNNKERLLTEQSDFKQLLLMLREVRDQFHFRLYNYELLNSHAHLILSSHDGGFIDKIMHAFCSEFAKYFNKRHGRSGHFWAHRYRSRIISNESHALACLRYQNRNAFSAGLVLKPEDWLWSGYHFYALGISNDLLEHHPCFLALHEDPLRRRTVYRKLVNTPIPSDKIPNLLEKGSGKATKRFQAMVEQTNRLKKKISI